MPMKPRTAIWMVCQPRADAESSPGRSAGAATGREALASLGSMCGSYPAAKPLCTEPPSRRCSRALERSGLFTGAEATEHAGVLEADSAGGGLDCGAMAY